mmetsp:Transcript_47598/g.103489  ORF Transcript_47598/g.103489 Transcript_47598/m.103489 type:complete len:230 (+) Transcript_47598:288-977(+)
MAFHKLLCGTEKCTVIQRLVRAENPVSHRRVLAWTEPDGELPEVVASFAWSSCGGDLLGSGQHVEKLRHCLRLSNLEHRDDLIEVNLDGIDEASQAQRVKTNKNRAEVHGLQHGLDVAHYRAEEPGFRAQILGDAHGFRVGLRLGWPNKEDLVHSTLLLRTECNDVLGAFLPPPLLILPAFPVLKLPRVRLSHVLHHQVFRLVRLCALVLLLRGAGPESLRCGFQSADG